MFYTNPILFYDAQQSIIDAYNMLKNKRSNVSDVKAYPVGFEYKMEIEEVCNSIETIISNIARLERKTSETKDKLISLDNAFAAGYYGCDSSKYDSLHGRLTSDEKNYISYSQERYAKKLYQYLDELNSKGKMPEKYKETYKSLKSNADLSNKVDELTKLQSNPVAPPKALSQRPNQQEMEEYSKKSQKYMEYQNKIKALKKGIKSIQKENGTYQNKWYEDWGEAFTKTGSAWGKAFKSGKLSDFADAYSQTKATGAVIKTSCVSGVIKLGEWATDGIVAIDGTIKSCEDWGATLLTTFDINKANKSFSNTMDKTLDYVRIDWTKKLNDWFYQDTEIGREINAKSNLKYDSAGATAIQNGSRYAVEFGICCIPGMQLVAPIILGLEGAGQSLESYTQSVDREHGESYNYGKVVFSEAVGGVGGAMKGSMYSKIGGNIISLIKDPSLLKTGLDYFKKTGVKNIIKNDVFSKDFAFDAVITAGQKGFEGYVEYNNTGNINLTKLAGSFISELCISRVLDNLMSKNLNGLINKNNPEKIVEVSQRLKDQLVDESKEIKKMASDKEMAEYFGDPDALAIYYFKQNEYKGKTYGDIKKLEKDYLFDYTYSREKIMSFLTNEQIAEIKKMELDENSLFNIYSKKLTEKEKRAIGSYTRSEGFDINKSLRNPDYYHEIYGCFYREFYASTIDSLDSAILKQSGLRKNEIKVFRGVDLDAFDCNDVLELKNKIGTVYSDKGYMSTSILNKKAFSKDIIMEIDVPPTAEGAYIEQFSNTIGKYAQDEFLLARNSSLVITDVIEQTNKNGIKEIIVKAKIL